MTDTRKAQTVAEQVGDVIAARATASRLLGFSLDEIGPGHARVSMTVTESMLNGVGTCHGGITFALADDAFAHACNSHNRMAVAANCSISYPAAARLGDRLTADCREIYRKGRNGAYDCVVTTQTGEVVALFRGQCRILEGHFIEGIS